MEWLFNGARARHSLDALERALLRNGTSSNESLHAQINARTKTDNQEAPPKHFKAEAGCDVLFGRLLHNALCCHLLPNYQGNIEISFIGVFGVWSVKCCGLLWRVACGGLWSVKCCGVWGVECRVWSAVECEVLWGVECGVLSAACGVWGVECGVE